MNNCCYEHMAHQLHHRTNEYRESDYGQHSLVIGKYLVRCVDEYQQYKAVVYVQLLTQPNS